MKRNEEGITRVWVTGESIALLESNVLRQVVGGGISLHVPEHGIDDIELEPLVLVALLGAGINLVFDVDRSCIGRGFPNGVLFGTGSPGRLALGGLGTEHLPGHILRGVAEVGDLTERRRDKWVTFLSPRGADQAPIQQFAGPTVHPYPNYYLPSIRRQDKSELAQAPSQPLDGHPVIHPEVLFPFVCIYILMNILWRACPIPILSHMASE